MRGVRIVLVALAFALAWPCPIAAASFVLAWDAPEGCPSEAEVRATAARWLDDGARANDAGMTEARAEVTRSGSEYALDLSVTTPSGTSHKQMTSPHCSTFAELIAIEVSLLAVPARAGAGASVADDRGAADPDPGTPVAPDAGWKVGGRVTAIGGSGPTPGLAPALGVFGSLHHVALRLELGASYGPGVDATYAGQPEIGASLEQLAGHARGCYDLLRVPIELPLCLGAEVGRVRASGFGVGQAFTTQRPWMAALLVQAARWPSSGVLAVWAEIAGAAAWLRPSFRIRNLDRLYATPPFFLRGALGVELQID